ncbi:hypothetical protein Tco_0024550 [Tanacetum coccineum]
MLNLMSMTNEQQHIVQSESIYDTYLLEKVDSNTILDSTNMCHRGGEIDQDAEHDQVKSPLLKAEFLKTNDMVEKEVYNELSNRFLQLEKHCISLEISIQQKEESFQSNKPCTSTQGGTSVNPVKGWKTRSFGTKDDIHNPEPMQEDQTGSNSGKLHVSLAGSNPEHMDDEFLATAYLKLMKTKSDNRRNVFIVRNLEVIWFMSSMKNIRELYFGDNFFMTNLLRSDQEKSKVIEESDSTIPDPSHQTVTPTPPVIAPFTDVSSTKPSSLVTPPPINTEATTIITSLPDHIHLPSAKSGKIGARDV